MADREETLSAISKRTEQLGDLPIFSASVNRVRKISTDPDSTAIALSDEISKDANLTVKILRLANSSYYNRGKGKIAGMSRAVVVLGFNTIKNICLTLKLIDSFQHEHPSIDMNRMLVNAYLAAGFVRELALSCGVRDVEEAYTCALLHNLGEIAVAYFLPEKYLQMKKLGAAGGKTPQEIERLVLGMSVKEIGQHLAASWEFPSNIVTTMENFSAEPGAGTLSGTKLNRALAALGNSVIHTLNDGSGPGERKLHELLGTLAETAGLDHDVMERGLVDSFKMSCELAAGYGLKSELLMPSLTESGDEFRDRLAGRLAYFASSYRPAHPATAPDEANRGGAPAPPSASQATPERAPPQAARTPPAAPRAPAANAGATAAAETGGAGHAAAKTVAIPVQLALVQELTSLIATGATLNDVLMKALEGIHRGAGFDRAVLILLSPDRSSYSARLAQGERTQELRDCFQGPLNPERDLFSKIALDGSELLVEDSSDPSWRPLLDAEFVRRTGARAFLLGALRHGRRPIGLFYADNALSQVPVSAEQQRGFQQFLAQARLALQVGNR